MTYKAAPTHSPICVEQLLSSPGTPSTRGARAFILPGLLLVVNELGRTGRAANLRSHPWANHAGVGCLEWRMPAFIHERDAETSKEHDMRQSVVMIMAAGAVTAFASFPVQAQYALCLPVRGCIPTTQASYNACYTLARQRGWTDSDNAPKGGMPRALDEFIWRCLQGRIPR